MRAETPRRIQRVALRGPRACARARSGRARRAWCGAASAGCGRGASRPCGWRGRAGRRLGCGVAERDQAQRLDLALGQVVGRARGFHGGGGEAGAQARVEVGVAGGRELDRLEQFLVRRFLEGRKPSARPAAPGGRTRGRPASSARRSRSRRPVRGNRGIASRLEHPGMLGSRTGTLGRCARVDPLRVGDGSGLRDHLEPVLVVDQRGTCLTDDRVVVGDHDGRLRAVGAHGVGHRRQRYLAPRGTTIIRAPWSRGSRSGGGRRVGAGGRRGRGRAPADRAA